MGVFSSALTGSLQGIAERPLPCNYNVIQPVSALSRRQHAWVQESIGEIRSVDPDYGLLPTRPCRI
jgi:hypothetical protein